MIGIEKYNPAWVKKYQNESKKIKEVLGDSVLDTQHIGSTSIPGMVAKPIIDIGVLVRSIENVSPFVDKLESLGYAYKPKMSSVERIFLRKGNPVEYHLSIACPRHIFWERNITFRDYLRQHSEFVDEYNNLKLKNIENTSTEDFTDLSRSKAYNQGKNDFVAKILELAKEDEN